MNSNNQTSSGNGSASNANTSESSNTTISVRNPPLYIAQGFSSLPTTLEPLQDLIDDGSIVTEVGQATIKKYPWYRQPFPSFELRCPQVDSVPDHVWGKIDLGDSYSNMSFRTLTVPVVNGSIIIEPEIFAVQLDLIKRYSSVRFDVQWMIHIPSPFGTAVFLEVQPLEYDRQTKCRSLKWKPATIPTIAVHTPFQHDKGVLQIRNSSLVPVPGFSSGSIKISCLDDNSTPSTLALSMVVGCAITNIRCTGLRPITKSHSTPTWLKFGDLEPNKKPVENVHNTMSGSEIEAEGGVGTDPPIIATTDNPLVVPITSLAEDDTNVGYAGEQSGLKELESLNAKWHFLNKYAISADEIGSWIDISIDPSQFKGLGENFSLPWRRNILTTGKQWMGALHTAILQINLPRPPTISGVLEFQFGTTGPRYLCEFGARIEIPCIPSNFYEDALTNAALGDLRLVSPWLKTEDSKIVIRYRCLAFNSGVERLDGTIQIAIRPGQSVFSIPKRPLPLPESPILEFLRNLEVKMADTRSANASDSFTPYLAQNYELGNTVLDDGEDEEEIPLDDFVIKVGNFDLTEEAQLIDFNLPAITDMFSEGSDNPITQKILRWGRIIPTAANGFGPLVGDYVIKVHVPTGVTGQIQHVALPGDLTVEAVSKLFGFGKILGVAGSAISAVGGPLLHGVVNVAGTAATSAANMIGGPLLGGVANAGVNVIKSLIPGGKKRAPPQQNPSVIGGQLPVSRWLSNIRPVKKQTDRTPIFPKLLVAAAQFIGNDLKPITKVPSEIFANFKYIKVARNLLNRLYDPITAYEKAKVTLTRYDVFSLTRLGFQCKKALVEGTSQNKRLKQLLVACASMITQSSIEYISVDEIIALDVKSLSLKDLMKQIEEAEQALVPNTLTLLESLDLGKV